MTRQERKVSAPRVVNVGDLRLLAQRRLPRVVFDYLDGGAEGEVTLRENTRAFEEVTFRPRNALYLPHRDSSTTVMGSRLAMPLLLAPCGFTHTAPGAHLLVGEAFLLCFVEGCLLDQDSLPFITLARATELDDDHGK